MSWSILLATLLASLPPLPLLFVAGLAVIVIYKYFKWEAIGWFSISLASGCSGALLLDNFNVIVLGNARDYCLVGLVCSVFLYCAALYKRYKRGRTGLDPTTSPPQESGVDAEFIHRDLMRQVGKVEKELGDPITEGRSDATSPGGAIPDKAATAPPTGRFEEKVKAEFSELGTRFANTTSRKLIQSIRGALTRLDELRKEVKNRPYRDMAEAEYATIAQSVGDFQVQEIKNERMKTNTAKNKFIDTLKLGPAELPDWPERITLTQLIGIGFFFLMLEFAVNLWYLRGVLGVEGAKEVASSTIALVFLFSSAVGYLFRFMRRNLPWLLRLVIGAICLILIALVLAGLGLLLALRDVDTVATDTLSLGAILRAYAGIFTDLNNLVLFFVNVFAIGVVYWEVLHWCEKFYGYDAVHDPYVAAVNEYKSLFSQDAESATSAIGKVKEKSDANREEALQLCETITEETATLENLMQIICTDYPAVLHPAYHKAIKSYRDSNTKHRVVEINPPPPYFAKSAEFPAPESHLTDSKDIAKFLEDKREEISQSSAVRDEITGASLLLDRERLDLHKELTDKFKAAIDKMGDGKGARPIDREAERNE